jgi:CBS-domain-containing membrane protein
MIFVTFFETSFITIGLAVGIATMLMMAFKITHPPAGGTVIVVIIGDVSFQFLIFPIMAGTITIIIGGIIYNRLLLKKKYPIT